MPMPITTGAWTGKGWVTLTAQKLTTGTPSSSGGPMLRASSRPLGATWGSVERNRADERGFTMRRLILILIACVFLMGACATSNNVPPSVIYPDPEKHPQDYNPGY